MRKKIKIYPDKEALFSASSDLLISAMRQAVMTHRVCTVALSGGNTPRGVYRHLAIASVHYRIPWQKIHLFWGDERVVPPDHEESNYRMVKETLLDHISIPPGNVHRIKAELGADVAAEEYADELKRFFKTSLPEFDIILLGLGTDGHTASLFPETPILEEKEKPVNKVFASAYNSWRISLTLPVINRARQIIFLASGENKSEIIREIFTLDKPSRKFPASLVSPQKGDILWMLDEAAASRLEREQQEI